MRLLGVCLLAAVITACSCGDGSHITTAQGGTGGGVLIGSSSSSGAGGDAAVSSSGTGSGAGTPSDWQEVGWPHNCDAPIWFTDEPKDDVPKQVWVPCDGGEPGCEKWLIDWNPPPPWDITLLTARGSAGAYHLAVSAGWSDTEGRGVVYEPGMSAVMAWRAALGCTPFGPLEAEAGVWNGAQKAQPSTFMFSRYGALQSPEPTSLGISAQGWAGSSSLLTLQPLGGGAIWIWDHVTKQSHSFSSGATNEVGVPVADSMVLFRHGQVSTEPKGWIWQRSTGQFSALHEPAGKAVVDLRGDSSTLVWIETDPPAPSAQMWPPGTLYTSPFATVPSGITPALVRNVPSFFNTAAFGEGHYAMLSAPDRKIHVYRLSDGRHWSFAAPQEAYAANEVVHVDATFVLYNTWEGIFRQSLAALGPGD